MNVTEKIVKGRFALSPQPVNVIEKIVKGRSTLSPQPVNVIQKLSKEDKFSRTFVEILKGLRYFAKRSKERYKDQKDNKNST